MNKTIIGIDLHGTLDIDECGFLRFLMYSYKLNNPELEIWIISGGKTNKDIEIELDMISIKKELHYDKALSVVEYLKSKGVEFKYDEKGNPWCDNTVWWKSKAQIVKEFNIICLIDDHIKYKEYFKECDCDENQFILYPDEFMKLLNLNGKEKPDENKCNKIAS